jgi:ethanolamine utilization protein EutP (predicted NTPase)
MIMINEATCGENTYIISIGTGTAYVNQYQVAAYNESEAVDTLADYIEEYELTGLYFTHSELDAIANCSDWKTAEVFAEAHGLVCCGNHGIYIELVGIEEVNDMSKDEWYAVVRKHLSENYSERLDTEAVEDATIDIVDRCFCYGVPTLAELPEYIAEYMDR